MKVIKKGLKMPKAEIKCKYCKSILRISLKDVFFYKDLKNILRSSYHTTCCVCNQDIDLGVLYVEENLFPKK